MHDFKYVTLLGKFYQKNLVAESYLSLVQKDMDEVIVPRKSLTWNEMMKGLEVDASDVDSFVFRNVFMTDEMLEDHQEEQETQGLLKGNIKFLCSNFQIFVFQFFYRYSILYAHAETYL